MFWRRRRSRWRRWGRRCNEERDEEEEEEELVLVFCEEEEEAEEEELVLGILGYSRSRGRRSWSRQLERWGRKQCLLSAPVLLAIC